MADFTRGPWRITKAGYDDNLIFKVQVGCNGRTVACAYSTTGDSDAEQTANAHLIAAAPELYEALNRLMNLNHFHLEDCIYEVREAVLSDEDYDGNTWDHPDVTAFSETVEKIKTALAKARGEK